MSGFLTALKWLHPGMRVKRWVFLGLIGLLLFMAGTAVIIQSHPDNSKPLIVRIADWIIQQMLHSSIRPGTLGLIATLLGALVCVVAFFQLIHSLTTALDPEMQSGGLVNTIYQRRKLAQGRRIVVIGGGTGLSTMLRGLKKYSSNITAVVTVADDGGSSGKLQRQLNILPPGDIRNCIVALADAEPQMTELFQYRFRNSVQPEYRPPKEEARGSEELRAGDEEIKSPGEEASSSLLIPADLDAVENRKSKIENSPESRGYGEGLRDHAFGNLLIAAMCAINGGDFEAAVRETSRVLNIRGRVLPSTVTHVRLRAEMEDGSFLEGETTIAHSPLKIKRVSLTPGTACPLDDVLDAILQADVIVMGPGSVFTSVIPNLLVKNIPEAIQRSKAKKVYVCNVMTQPGETDGFSAFDHIRAIEHHARRRVFDYVLVNTGRPTQELMEKYRKSGSVLVEADIDRIKSEGYRPITGNFINQTDVVRHNSGTLAEAIMRLLD